MQTDKCSDQTQNATAWLSQEYLSSNNTHTLAHTPSVPLKSLFFHLKCVLFMYLLSKDSLSPFFYPLVSL